MFAKLIDFLGFVIGNCVDTKESYYCECLKGYILDKNGKCIGNYYVKKKKNL